VIAYCVDGDDVLILRVLRGSRDIESAVSRLGRVQGTFLAAHPPCCVIAF
jgi:hypothetical protein